MWFLKKLILITTFLLIITNLVFAEVYLIVDKTTKEIYTASEKDDTAIPAGKEKVVLSGGFANYELKDNPTNYFYKNNKFILNTEKINAEAEAEKLAADKAIEEVKIKEEMRAQAITSLKNKGVELKVVTK